MNINGIVKDSATGETLPYANIFPSTPTGEMIPGNTGTTSDLQGFYSFNTAATHLTASYTGYKRQTKPTGAILNFNLQTDAYNLPEVIISAKMVWPRVLAALIAVAAAYFIYTQYFKK